MKKCDTCIYRNENEYHKPCIVYQDDCEFYEKERGDMTREDAIYYLKCSGMSDEQIKAVETGFLSVIEDIKAEIVKTVEEEKQIDKKWSSGLKYALQIIDKHIGGDADESNH